MYQLENIDFICQWLSLTGVNEINGLNVKSLVYCLGANRFTCNRWIIYLRGIEIFSKYPIQWSISITVLIKSNAQWLLGFTVAPLDKGGHFSTVYIIELFQIWLTCCRGPTKNSWINCALLLIKTVQRQIMCISDTCITKDDSDHGTSSSKTSCWRKGLLKVPTVLEQEWFTPGNLDLCPSWRSFSESTGFYVEN